MRRETKNRFSYNSALFSFWPSHFISHFASTHIQYAEQFGNSSTWYQFFKDFLRAILFSCAHVKQYLNVAVTEFKGRFQSAMIKLLLWHFFLFWFVQHDLIDISMVYRTVNPKIPYENCLHSIKCCNHVADVQHICLSFQINGNWTGSKSLGFEIVYSPNKKTCAYDQMN